MHHGDSQAGPELVVVGAGAAGLYASLCAAREGARVALISARPLAETASYWAQGGLAAALAIDDSPEQHLEDTLAAGRGLVRRAAAEVLCREAPARLRDLVELGVRFDGDHQGNLDLGLEGGHSRRRVLHAGGSATGRRILRQLSACVAEHPRIDVLEGRRASALALSGEGRAVDAEAGRARAFGSGAGDAEAGTLRGSGGDGAGRVAGVALDDGRTVAARAVILATGGAAALWSRTTNPPGSWGSGLLLARTAGAALADLELTQFHPTAVAGVRGREGFLISEAVRGEGATLHDAAGERFVDELQPRDAVARAIHRRLRETGEPAVYLDMRAIDPARFPNVVEALRDAGVDPTRERIPVSPASHYMMGGIVTDLEGRTTVPGLYSVGECACTGLHGANRLASNSLSECFVFGRRAALAALDEPPPQPPNGHTSELPPPPTRETRKAMWRHAGLERDAAGLQPLLHDAHPLARAVARCALAREETRGAHARLDFPDSSEALDGHHTLLTAATDDVELEPWI